MEKENAANPGAVAGRQWWPWLWGGIHGAVGALGPVSLLLAYAYLWRNGTTPSIAGLYVWLSILLATLVLLSIAQWLMLRMFFPALRWWPLLTAGSGVIAGGTVLYIVWARSYVQSLGLNIAVYTLIFGVIGVAQWSELRHTAPHAGWWIVASILGSIALWMTYAVVAAIGPVSAAAARGRDIRAAVALAVQGGTSLLAYATITALALWLITRQRMRRVSIS